MSAAIRVIHGLAAARKAVQLYPPEHPAYKEAVGGLVSGVADATSEGPLTLNIHEGHAYQGSAVLNDDSPSYRAIVEAMESRRLESLTFQAGFDIRDAVALTEVLSLQPGPDLDLAAELEKRGTSSVTVSWLADEDKAEAEERDKRRDADRALYKRAISHARKAADGGEHLSQAGQTIADMLGRFDEDPAAVLRLATMTGRGEAGLFHAVNVMIYSLALGESLGLPDEGLVVLGLAALLHDAGKTALDGEDADPEAVRLGHPAAGAQVLSSLSDEDKAAMLVAYEHHMNLDGTGWPEREEGYVPHPFSRIVAIADRYENLTKPHDGSEPMRPDEAVSVLLSEGGRTLDGIFVRLFVRAVGVFPVGCPVRLSDHSVGIVSEIGEDLLRPVVRVVFGPDGHEMQPPLDVDMKTDERTIVEALEAAVLDLKVSDHL